MNASRVVNALALPAVAIALTAACAVSDSEPTAATAAPAASPSLSPDSTTAPTTSPGPASTIISPPTSAPPATSVPAGADITIGIALDRRVADPGTDTFADEATATLTDPRGWTRAGFRFTFGGEAPFSLVLAEPDVVDALCAPYRTRSQYSCQNGSVVALNAERWRSAIDTWPGSLIEYRSMLINHEVGHLLGQHHPDVRCPARGAPAPVMAQQTIGLEGCAANPWPLDWEVTCAERRLEPIAPEYEAESLPLCGPGDV